MTFILILLPILVGILVYMYAKKKYRPESRKRQKAQLSAQQKFIKFQKDKKRQARVEKIMSGIDIFSNSKLSDYKRNRYEYIIMRLNLDNMTPERIFTKQLVYAGVCFIFGIVFFQLMKIIGIILIGFGVYAYLQPLREYEKIIKKKDNAIVDDMFGYYSLLVSTYLRSNDTPLADITVTFMESCNRYMREELSILISNIDIKGPVFALLQMKARVRNTYVMRVCDSMITRFTSRTDNSSAMLFLKEELRTNGFNRQADKQKNKKKIAQVAQFSQIITLIVFIMLHLYFQVFKSLKVLFSS